MQIHVGTLNAFPLGSSHQYRAQWPHRGELRINGKQFLRIFTSKLVTFLRHGFGLSKSCLLLLYSVSSSLLSSRMGRRAGHTTSPLFGTNILILLFIMVPRLQHQQSYASMLVYQPQVAVTFGLGVVQVVAMQQHCVKFSWQNAQDVRGFLGNEYAVFKLFGIRCPVLWI